MVVELGLYDLRRCLGLVGPRRRETDRREVKFVFASGYAVQLWKAERLDGGTSASSALPNAAPVPELRRRLDVGEPERNCARALSAHNTEPRAVF
jgi:hypothetical protein